MEFDGSFITLDYIGGKTKRPVHLPTKVGIESRVFTDTYFSILN